MHLSAGADAAISRTAFSAAMPVTVGALFVGVGTAMIVIYGGACGGDDAKETTKAAEEKTTAAAEEKTTAAAEEKTEAEAAEDSEA